MLESGDEVHREPLMGCRSILGPFFIARWARSLCCHLCSSQTVPSVLGNRVSITGYTHSRVHHRRVYLWGTVFHERRSPISLALTAPRKGSCRVVVASCIASQSPWSPGSREDFAWLSFTQRCWRAPSGDATWPQAVPGVGGAVGAEGRGNEGVSVSCGERLVRRLHDEEEGTGLWGGTEKVSSPFPGMEGGDQTGTMWRPKLSPCSFMWFPW